jgi:predicted XRE-type DNA-binding protein
VTKHYTATANREGRWWVITVPGIGATQSRTLRDAGAAARGLVSAMRDVTEDALDVTVVPELDEQSRRLIDRARLGIDELEAQQRQVALVSRAAVTALADQGLSGADIATVLRVSPQRVSQLMKDGPTRIIASA